MHFIIYSCTRQPLHEPALYTPKYHKAIIVIKQKVLSPRRTGTVAWTQPAPLTSTWIVARAWKGCKGRYWGFTDVLGTSPTATKTEIPSGIRTFFRRRAGPVPLTRKKMPIFVLGQFPNPLTFDRPWNTSARLRVATASNLKPPPRTRGHSWHANCFCFPHPTVLADSGRSVLGEATPHCHWSKESEYGHWQYPI